MQEPSLKRERKYVALCLLVIVVREGLSETVGLAPGVCGSVGNYSQPERPKTFSGFRKGRTVSMNIASD